MFLSLFLCVKLVFKKKYKLTPFQGKIGSGRAGANNKQVVQVLLAHFSPCVFHSSAHSLVVAAVWVKITVENTQDAKTDTLLTSERADLGWARANNGLYKWKHYNTAPGDPLWNMIVLKLARCAAVSSCLPKPSDFLIYCLSVSIYCILLEKKQGV